VLALLYTGSLERGTADRYSDLDIEVWVPEAAFAAVQPRLHTLLAALGMVQFTFYRAPATARALSARTGTTSSALVASRGLKLSRDVRRSPGGEGQDGVLTALVAASAREIVQAR
jgi:hypothetical protein